MPAKIEASIKKSVRKAHPGYSDKQVDAETFATMNEKGYVHGNVETSRGKRAEAKYEVEHHDG